MLGGGIQYAFTCLLEMWLFKEASNGVLMAYVKRNRNVARILYLHIVLSVLQILWIGFGLIGAFTPTEHCHEVSPGLISAIKAVVLSNLIVFILFLLGILFLVVFASASKYSIVEYRRLWERRCKLFCCCSQGSTYHKTGLYDQITDLLAHYFKDLDLCPSDIMAGMLLIGASQKEDNTLADFISKRPALNLDNVDEAALLDGATHYATYAVGAYGWKLYVFMNVFNGVCHLMGGVSCSRKVNVFGDNCCFCDFAGLKKLSDLADSQIIYADFSNNLFQPAHFVAIDHSRCEVVVSIRGSMSFNDFLVDILAIDTKVEIPNLPEVSGEIYTHEGFLKSTLQTKATLDERGVLAMLFSKHPSYKLVIVGHSLGAAVATLLALMYHSRYPNLRCFAYSPPGKCVCVFVCLLFVCLFVCLFCFVFCFFGLAALSMCSRRSPI